MSRRAWCKQADGWGWGMSVARGLMKRMKARIERRRARRDPECEIRYGRYRGYLT